VSTSLTVRSAGLEDVSALASLIERCDRTYIEWAPVGWIPPSSERDRANLAEEIQDDAAWTRVATDDGDEPLGLVSWRVGRATRRHSDPVVGAAHLAALFVEPSSWRSGIASALLATAETAMRDDGFDLATLWTPAGAPARTFYERRGWVLSERRRWSTHLELPLVGYEKRLSDEL
jgi:GNAT superfamily N-acetyltransferase